MASASPAGSSPCWTGTDRPSVLFDRATAWPIARKVLLPGATTLERLVARVRARTAERLWRRLTVGVTPEQCLRLEGLVAAPEGGRRQSPLDRLRNGPVLTSGRELARAVRRLAEVQDLAQDLPRTDRLPRSRVLSLARFAGASKAQAIARLPGERRIARTGRPRSPAAPSDSTKPIGPRPPACPRRGRAGHRERSRRNRPDLVVTALDKLEEPPSLVRLRDAVAARLPRVDLPELVLEIEARTGFVDAFTHASEAGSRIGGLGTSISAVPIAEACNTGFEPLVRPDIPALRRSRLSWIKHNYLRAETLVAANAKLVAAQNGIALAQAWGGGEVASADGLRFVVPVRTMHAGPNPRYFGQGRGVTYYNLMSDQFTGLNGIIVPGTLRDSLTLLALVLEQETSLEPVEIMTDTGAYTDVIFGIFWLLGFQFSPRLADIGGARFWRLRNAEYGPLDGLARHRAKPKLIVQHWDDLLRLAGSLKLGLVQASGLMRTLQTNERPTRLAQALGELGRIVKTIYMLTLIDDADERRRILGQINRHECRHTLARVVFHAKRGELRQRYREGQEDQLGALGLVVNTIVLWNTIYMDAALAQLRAEGFPVRDEDVARLSPLGFAHINMLGRYAFVLPEAVARGELRPLRDPSYIGDDSGE